MKKTLSILSLCLLLGMNVSAQQIKPTDIPMMRGANDPVGTPQGIHPGRVAWAHAPGAATWPGEGNGMWSDDQWNNQELSDWLVANSIIQLTGEKNENKAWKALFTSFNVKQGKKAKGYQKGEKIGIKVNMNNTGGYADDGQINASPHLILSLLRSMIKMGGVPQECITVFDASRYLTDAVYYKCYNEFPNVNYVDHIGGEGRTKSTFTANAIHYSKKSERMCTGLTNAAVEADYLINMAILKGHVGQGITLCGKNWYGATDINEDWRKNAHVNMNQDKRGNPRYITFVDYMGHEDMGGKVMLYLIDALYGCKLVDGIPKPKWNMDPFNGNWPCSLFASQDGVAIDSVGLDFLVSEFPDAPDMRYADAYIVEAAMADNAPSGTSYDPENDGTTLKSLGVAEHWNNPNDKKYNKIDLVYIKK